MLAKTIALQLGQAQSPGRGEPIFSWDGPVLVDTRAQRELAVGQGKKAPDSCRSYSSKLDLVDEARCKKEHRSTHITHLFAGVAYAPHCLPHGFLNTKEPSVVRVDALSCLGSARKRFHLGRVRGKGRVRGRRRARAGAAVRAGVRVGVWASG